MKKLLFAIAGAASFAAFADPSSGGAGDISWVGFENYSADAGVVGIGDDGGSGGSLWSCAGDDASLVKTLGGDNAAVPAISRPALFAEETNTKYLALDTNGAELQRAIPAAGQTIGASGIYVDTLVQFTPSESAPSVETDLVGAKLAIWLGVDTSNNTTNLYVQGAYYDTTDGFTLNATSNQAYKLNKSCDPGTWYRLTVKAIDTIGNENTGGELFPGFVISIDGEEIATSTAVYSQAALTQYFAPTAEGAGGADDFVDATELALLKSGKFIPSLDSTRAPATLTAVGFKGTGALDDFVVTTEPPSFTPPAGDDYVVEIAGSDVVITPQAGDLAALQAAIVAGGGTLDVTDVAAVNAALAAPIPGTSPAIPSWQALFLGVAPTTNGLEQVAIESVTIANGTVTVVMSDDLTLMTGRGVDIVLKVLGSDDLSTWDTTNPLATATNTLTIPAITPAANETKKFYKVVVDFAASPAQ